jgi:hypothetical protein
MPARSARLAGPRCRSSPFTTGETCTRGVQALEQRPLNGGDPEESGSSKAMQAVRRPPTVVTYLAAGRQRSAVRWISRPIEPS